MKYRSKERRKSYEYISFYNRRSKHYFNPYYPRTFPLLRKKKKIVQLGHCGSLLTSTFEVVWLRAEFPKSVFLELSVTVEPVYNGHCISRSPTL